MDTPLPPFRPHRVQLVGHRDIGIVPARFDGPWLEIDHPEHGGRYGPAAVFRAVPVVEASRGALAWHKEDRSWNLCHPGLLSYRHAPYSAIQGGRAHSFCSLGSMLDRGVDLRDTPAAITQITTWAREDGYEVPPWPGEPAAPVEPQPEPVPAPVGTWGGHTDWIAWGGGECPVDAGALVGLAFRDGGTGDFHRTDAMRWGHTNGGGDIIAYRIVQPAPKDRTVYDPDDIRRGDRHVFRDSTVRTVLGVAFGRVIYGAGRGPGHHLNITDVNGDVVSVEPVDPPDNF